MYGLLESVLGVKGFEVRQSAADIILSPCSAQFWHPSTLVHLGSCSESEFGTTD